MSQYKNLTFVVGMLATMPLSLWAQSIVDPSVLNPRTQERLAPPKQDPVFSISGKDMVVPTTDDGEKFVLNGIRFEGNSVLAVSQLDGVVISAIGQAISVSQLQVLAAKVDDFYREQGYPFAHTYILPQDVNDGVVIFTVREGQYGDILATVGNEKVREPRAEAQAYLANLSRGGVIHAPSIERIALILNDLPGYSAVPIVRPSTDVGAGDIEVRLTELPRLKGMAGIDNHGSSVTGKTRAKVDVENARNFIFGDSIKLSGLMTDGKTGFASATYAFPLLPNGTRMELSALQSTYVLGGTLKLSNFSGESTILGAQVAYPLVRSQDQNLSISGAFQNRQFTNDRGLIEHYTINAVPLTLNFDWHDQLNGGAVTYGALTWTHAHVAKDNSVSASRDKNFSKTSLDVSRLQKITTNLQASVKYSGQYSADLIDSTEFISLAGPSAVRAYPVGEFSGHNGWFGQVELAYSLPSFGLTPYVFYDKAEAKNRTTTLSRTLAGQGVGVRFNRNDWSVDVSASWAKLGGASLAEPDGTLPRVWASVGLRF